MEEDLGAHLSEATLGRINLFRQVDFSPIFGIFDLCSTVKIKAGELLLRAGEKNNSVYILLSGRLSVHFPFAGKEEAVFFVEPGESVGEMSVLDQEPVSADVFAIEDSVLLKMDEDIVWSLVHSSHAFACNLLTLLTSRLRRTNFRITGRVIDVDVLTGLRRREWFQEILARYVRRAVEDGAPTSIILIEVDELDDFIKRNGRHLGERVLYVIASTLKNNLRPSELVARWGESGFAVLLPLTGKEKARTVAVRLHEVLNRALSWVPTITISMGLAEERENPSPLVLVAEGEDALKRAKQMGGGVSE
ncbi:MAG: diguanylate cyclase [Syntrophales bacterium]|nr:diguanylate cyclase [Syntrophales bacterium]